MSKPTGREIYERKIETGETWTELAEAYKESRSAIRGRARSYQDSEGLPPPEKAIKGEDSVVWTTDDDDFPPEGGAEHFNFRVDGDEATASIGGKRIRSLEQLLDAIKANGGDLEPWRVRRHLVNVWEMGRKNKVVDMRWDNGVATGYVKDSGGWTNKANWQVKAWFEPRLEYPVEKAIERLVERLEKHVPDYDPPAPIYSDGAYLNVWNLYDAHFGKLSVDGTYTLERASDTFAKAGRALAGKVQSLNMPIKRILFPIGQDALHADNLKNTTTAGTWVEVAADMRDAIDALCAAVVTVIEAAATIAPVEVLAIPDNHSRYSAHWLGKVVEAWFRSHPNVTVDAMREDRKYYQFGKVLLGIDHGDKVKPDKLALTMAVEAPQMWADTTYREWLRGHLHKSAQMYYPATEEKGVSVRVIPALCPPDSWHVLHGFVGNHRAAEGLFYHEIFGPAGQFQVFVDEL